MKCYIFNTYNHSKLSINYNKMASEMFQQSKLNFDIVKNDITNNLGKHVSHITIHLKQLDTEHYQLENGVTPCQFSSFVLNSRNIWKFCQQTYELDDCLQTFRIRDDCIVVGDLIISLLNGTTITGFCIKPTIIDGKQSTQQLTVSPIYDQLHDQESMVIKLELDKSKRIKQVDFPTINISKYPNLQNMILKEVINGYETVHTKNTLELMNKLSYESILNKSKATV